jgi:hypothetical protein
VTPLAFALHTAAVVLTVAGVAKLVDPGPVTRSLAAARLPASPIAGRGLGAGEVAIGIWVLVAGGRASAAALGVWYLAFVIYLVANRLRGLDVPCGCVGESDRPAGPAHIVVDLLAVGAGLAAAIRPVGDVSSWLDEGATGALALGAMALLSAAVVVLVLPGRIGAGRPSH